MFGDLSFTSREWRLPGAPSSHPVLFEILSLLKNLFVDLVAINRWVGLYGEKQDKIHLQFNLEIFALIPVGTFEFIINKKRSKLSSFSEHIFGAINSNNACCYKSANKVTIPLPAQHSTKNEP